MTYRWERDEETYHSDGGMLLRTDDDRPLNDALVAQYWMERYARTFPWSWMTAVAFPLQDEGECWGEDSARFACLMAVLHGAQP